MTKFKVGDKVKIVSEISGHYRILIGTNTQIESVDSGGYSLVGIEPGRWQDSELELIKSKVSGWDIGAMQKLVDKHMQTYSGGFSNTWMGYAVSDWKPRPYIWNGIDSLVKVDKSNKKENKNMKYYRVIQDTPAWLKGAILKQDGETYEPISDLWNTDAHDKKASDVIDYSEMDYIIENSPEWFERVHEVSVLGKMQYLTTTAARKSYNKLFKEA